MKQVEKTVVETGYQKEFGKAKGNEDHFTLGIGPCVGIGFFEKKTKESYIIHTPNIADVEDYIKTIRTDFKNKSNIKVKARGLSRIALDQDDDDVDLANADRKTAESLLYKYFDKENVDIKWGKYEITDLYIDKQKGKIISESEDEVDLIDTETLVISQYPVSNFLSIVIIPNSKSRSSIVACLFLLKSRSDYYLTQLP